MLTVEPKTERRAATDRPGVWHQIKEEPLSRGDAFSFVHKDKFYVCNGKLERVDYRGNLPFPLLRYDFSSVQWSGVFPACVNYEPEEDLYWTDFKWSSCRGHDTSGACCAVLGDCAYTFGGLWTYGYAVHELNLETVTWRRVEPHNRGDGPMWKKKAGMVVYGDEVLCVFGGYGPDTGRHQPGATYLKYAWGTPNCFSNNELHLFHIGTEFSLTKVDLSRVVLFGGDDMQHETVNEVHILDVENWHWSGAILSSGPVDIWPQSRHAHSACLLYDPTPSSASGSSSNEISHLSSSDMSNKQHNPKPLVLWGRSEKRRVSSCLFRHEPMEYPWTLDVNSITWKQVRPFHQPRYNFSLGCHYRSPTELELVVFGGLPSCFIANTTLFYMGVKTLYHSCVDYVARQYAFYEPLVQELLPPHIQTDICREKGKRALYRVAQL